MASTVVLEVLSHVPKCRGCGRPLGVCVSKVHSRYRANGREHNMSQQDALHAVSLKKAQKTKLCLNRGQRCEKGTQEPCIPSRAGFLAMDAVCGDVIEHIYHK